jgi:hypothetical protein
MDLFVVSTRLPHAQVQRPGNRHLRARQQARATVHMMHVLNTKLTMSPLALQAHICPAQLLCAMSHAPGAGPLLTQALASASVHAPQRLRGRSICAAMTLHRCPRLAAHRQRNPGQPRAPGSQPTSAGLASFRTKPARTQNDEPSILENAPAGNVPISEEECFFQSDTF